MGGGGGGGGGTNCSCQQALLKQRFYLSSESTFGVYQKSHGSRGSYNARSLWQ